MASNNFAVVNSQFTPFTYDELIKPLQIANEAQTKVEDAYTDLMTKAATVEAMADQEQDKDVYMQYKTFADKLKQAADNVATRGIDPSSRRTLMGLNKEYGEKIVPIQTAYARRQQLADEQRKGLLSNPTALYDKDISQVGLRDFMDNPNLGYKSHSGAVLTKQASDMAGALAKEIREGVPYDKSTFKHQIDKYTYELIRQFGVTREDVLRAIYDPENANPALTSIVKQVYDSSGIDNWGNDDAKKQAAWYASQGLWSAVGETKFDTQPDFIARLNAQAAKEMQVARAKAGAGGDPSGASIRFWPVDMRLGTSENDVVTGYRIPVDHPQNILNDLYNIRKSADGNFRIKEINGIDKDGNLKLKDAKLSKSDIYDDKNKMLGDPTFILSPDSRMRGVVMSFGDKKYFLTPDNFDNDVRDTVFGANGLIAQHDEAIADIKRASDEKTIAVLQNLAKESMEHAMVILTSSLSGAYEEPTYKVNWQTSTDRKI